MNDNKRIVEIDGVKVEVDLRTAKKIDYFRVGDNVKILHNGIVKPAIIVDFAEFKDLPTMVIAYFEGGDYWTPPTIKFIYYNAENTEKIDIVPTQETELLVSKESVCKQFEQAIDKKRKEYEDLKTKYDYFKKNFLRNVEMEV